MLLVPDNCTRHFQSHITATIIIFSSTNNLSRASSVMFPAKREKFSFLITLVLRPHCLTHLFSGLRKLASALQRAAASSSSSSAGSGGGGDEVENENQGFAIAPRQVSSGAMIAPIHDNSFYHFIRVHLRKLCPEHQRHFVCFSAIV